MAGGFLAGLVAGAVASGVALAAASVALGPEAAREAAPAPGAAALDMPPGSGFSQARDDTAARLPAADGAPGLATDAPQVAAIAPDDLSQVAAEDTQPTMRPEISAPEAALSAPEAGEVASGMSGMSGAAKDNANGQSAPDAPVTERGEAEGGDPAISTDPAQPSLPDIEEGAAFEPPLTEQNTAPPQEAVPESTSEAPEVPRAADGADAETGPSGTIGDRAEGVETSRLPSVGDAGDAGAALADGTPRTVLPMIEANAEAFDNPEGKPLMSIVLIDDGSSPIGLDALEAFPYPLSFAVDAAWPGAEEAMHRYRDAGFEVLAIANLPEGATARDAEITLATVRDAVPEAVAVLEGTGAGLQAGREASEQLAPILKETGQGLVLFPKGLQTAPKLIAREGVPVGTVFRDFDAEGQSVNTIRRFLDQAALKAGRDEEGVIMLGRLRADTISALLLWGLQDRASRVALAPVSAVLTGGH